MSDESQINQENQKETRKKDDSPLTTDEVIKDKGKVDFTKGGVENYKFYPDNPVNHRHKYRWSMKEPSKYYDPCEESRQASINCMLRNQEDKTVCQDFFDAYKECKKDFFNKKVADRRQGKGGWGIW
ncbi:DEHA2F20526p [Debaryomyces hansenii CBS767]|jgi:cytochrome c oxidase assembly protein subunit 23|uniref:Cytochrome c oxidase-assembly factor COX23, mitochondrial n=1 Tax=Debaryomyces hansenii (strain ATCC 36239 / CBS 767 / BCRC 21394 / JCM 1990 / NBRC 0083 / IGC 2968) TaxID=284592 RepID=COX23_DEBHA|nr:DEHA2F20526p [Debaryomyces hansenii CBS767]Q6BKN1.1 RecName: Full=Cytochrome c oxidase-assembly factor COX23, mitochondrial; Flags: Precursor [Debaryomyces hansenii CBS767]CAG89628.1 DEHA2F20526p [Debaryomyces hansenii CBS767]|eukprot:XP_461240.1 DEHA2F20526p [Debaryomyces hansenii CBS767]